MQNTEKWEYLYWKIGEKFGGTEVQDITHTTSHMILILLSFEKVSHFDMLSRLDSLGWRQ